MTTAVLDRPTRVTSVGPIAGLRLMVLARIACDEGASRPELARELGPYVGKGPVARLPIEAELAQLVRDGHAIESRSRFTASATGAERLLGALALKALPKTWSELRDVRLVAMALGLEREPAGRLKHLSEAEVLRAEIVIEAYGLNLKGSASCSKLRGALSLVALERAFGNRIKGELPTSSGLNAKASRVLAGQLLRKPRDAGTDKRLVALLAAEAVGTQKIDADLLRAALLQRLAQGATARAHASAEVAPLPHAANTRTSPAEAPVSEPAQQKTPKTSAEIATASARPPSANRPDLAGFVKVVRAAAASNAEGWPGNRKALVSRVFAAIAAAHPGWGLSLVEFKAMLAECHRIGQLALATADLKDKRLLDEIRQSAIAYKNTVWHLVRVED